MYRIERRPTFSQMCTCITLCGYAALASATTKDAISHRVKKTPIKTALDDWNRSLLRLLGLSGRMNLDRFGIFLSAVLIYRDFFKCVAAHRYFPVC